MLTRIAIPEGIYNNNNNTNFLYSALIRKPVLGALQYFTNQYKLTIKTKIIHLQAIS